MKRTNFRPLHVPEYWRHYWTKYPEGYTMLEGLMSWVSHVDELSKSVNETTDYVTTTLEGYTANITQFKQDMLVIQTSFENRIETKIEDYQQWVVDNSQSIIPYMNEQDKEWTL